MTLPSPPPSPVDHFYSNFGICNSFVIFFACSRGSVIADFSVSYNYLDHDQVVFVLDEMESKKRLSNMSVGFYSTNSTKSKMA